MEILVITGPPYSGKGTQCDILKKKFGFTHISTGDRCRLEKENKTDIGKILSLYEERGDLVPDSIIRRLFKKIIDENQEEKAILLDGYPRTEPQVKDLIELASKKGIKINKTINISVSHEELLIRAKKRAKTSNRADDKIDKVHEKRIELFEKYTQPAIDCMRSKLDFVDCSGIGNPGEISERIQKSLQIEFN